MQPGERTPETNPRGADENRNGGDPSSALPLTSSVTPLSLSDVTRLRQASYKLFGSLYLYPTQERLARMVSGAAELQKSAPLWRDVAFAEPLERLLCGLDDTDRTPLLQIEEEYLRLFQVKPAATPYESFYLDPEGQARAWIASGLERVYAEAGLALSRDLHDMPDHVAVEFEFMSFLCGREAEARENGDGEGAAEASERQRAFLGTHLGRWFPRFANLTAQAEPKGPYDVVTQSAYGFLYHDLDLLDLRSGTGAKLEG